MENIHKNELEKIALLARIKLTGEELDLYSPQLGEILHYFDILNEVDTKDVNPTSHPTKLKNVFRLDKEENSLPLTSTEATYNSKNIKDNLFKVQKTL